MTSQQPDESGFISLQSWQNMHDRTAFEHAPVDLPRLTLWNYRHKLSPEDMQGAISEVWMFVNDGLAALPNLPEGSTVERLTHDEWVELFGYAGYIRLEDPELESAGVTCETPSTLYRYAEKTGKTGLSWTTSIEEALAYAGRFGDEPRNGCVWSVTGVDPGQVLAHFHQKIGEDEYVFDPRGSEIAHAQSGHGCTCEQS
ncbi:hypothetical protein CH299_28540 [Rhodococcus sp. 14-2686-1-2]|nr:MULTISPECIES: hypothetical protein [unclassified Rhodococcus (in: high G+C Gram-positive bacteria)]OZE92864.1 hypothetical protein CH301_28020 [Rhodococcus sp. 15-1189-1-1a]OZF08120.1 hypothetical protein CH299_28540 [Rhodococcus sp. 14-2686-1-2]